MVAKAHVDDGARLTLEARQFGAVALEATVRRGGVAASPLAVAGRNRIAILFGGSGGDGTVVVGEGSNVFGGFQYTHYFREDLAMTFAMTGGGAMSGVSSSAQGRFAGQAMISSMPIGLRWNPLHPWFATPGVKPYLNFALGPVYGLTNGAVKGPGATLVGSHVYATIGGQIGGGVDFHAARAFSVGVNAGYNWMADFPQPVGSRRNYNGPEVDIAFGFLWGKGRQ